MANVLLVADESEISLPNVGWLTLTENEDQQKITIDTSELKSEYDSEIRTVLKNINAGCAYFGGKVLLFNNLREVDARIPKIASLYRQAREGAYR